MQCPKMCGTDLKSVERNNVTIDICPTCRGIWLDRGELERMLDTVFKEERDAHPMPAAAQPAPAPNPGYYTNPKYNERDRDERYRYYHGNSDDHYKKYGYKNKPAWKQFLEVFD